MKWPPFEASEKEYPEIVVERNFEGFSKATRELVDIRIREAGDIGRMDLELQVSFQFELLLYSEYLREYRFRVMRFGYDVRLYPVFVIFNYDIALELYPDARHDLNMPFNFENENELDKCVKSVIKTSFFIDTVRGLMKIAKKRQDMEFWDNDENEKSFGL